MALTYWSATRSASEHSLSKSRPRLPKLATGYKRLVSNSHVYVFVNIKEDDMLPEFFVIPSRVVAKKAYVERFGKGSWYSFTVQDAKGYQDRWEIFGGS